MKMACYVPPRVFHDHTRHTSLTPLTTPLLTLSCSSFSTKPPSASAPASITTSKKGRLRPRLLLKRRRHTVSNEIDSAGLTCDRRPSKEINQLGGHGTEQQGGDELADGGVEPSEPAEKFIEWLCSTDSVRRERERQGQPDTVEAEPTCFRCDIFATSGEDFAEAEKECKQLVVEAGGTILDGHEYLGGFLYTLPPNLSRPPPLESSDETLLGGYIRITPFAPLPSPIDVQQEYLRTDTPPTCPAHNSTGTLIQATTSSLISPWTTRTDSMHTNGNPSSDLPLRSQSSSASIPSTISKDWPRPKDDSVTKRGGDWVKAKAARQKERIDEEVRSGAGMEVVSESAYEGGIQTNGLYLDAFNDLAVWMGAGGRSRTSLVEPCAKV